MSSPSLSLGINVDKLRGAHCLSSCKGRRAAICFTGGKDCHLALQRCLSAGLDIVCLAIFHPPGKLRFQAHRMEWQCIQATAMGIPLIMCCLSELEVQKNESVPQLDYKAAYAAAIRRLHEAQNISLIVTGDIDYVGSSTTNFMQDVCLDHDCHGVQVLLPLWKQSRKALLQEILIDLDMDVRISCVKSPYFDGSWIGRRLDIETVKVLETKDGLDLNGENGEYHTMVVNGPMYKKPLKFDHIELEELTAQQGQKNDELWWVLSANTTLIPQEA